nr:hypothetical protein [uncultured Methanolobus sp.]
MQTGTKKNPFSVMKITEKLPVVAVNVEARAIRTRKIRLLEWAILAPLCELSDPAPTLEEIKKEFGIEKIEFLQYVAKELVMLDALTLKGENDLETTELGRELYSSGKMISNSRGVHFDMVYEPESTEWFPGARYDSGLEDSENQNDDIRIPDFVPEALVREHISLVKNILEKDEKLIEHAVSGAKAMSTDIEVDILLKNEGVDLAITKEPFGDAHRLKLKQAMKQKILDNGKLNRYLEKYHQKAAQFTNSPIVQYHTLFEKDKLYSPLDESKLTDAILSLKPKWVIVANQNLFEYIAKNKNKPEVIIYIAEQNNDLKHRINQEHFIPSSVELYIQDKEHLFTPDSVISENRIVMLNLIEAGNYTIPMYILRENAEDYSAILSKILKDSSSDVLDTKIAAFYLEPLEENFNAVIECYPDEYVNDKKTAQNALKEITLLKNKMKDTSLKGETKAAVYKKIIEFSDWKEMIKFDSWFVYHSRALFFEKLGRTVTNISNPDKGDVLGYIRHCSSIHKDLGEIKANLKKAAKDPTHFEILEETDKLQRHLEQYIESTIQELPVYIKKEKIEDILKVLENGINNARHVYLKKVKTAIDSSNLSEIEEDTLDVCLLLKQNGLLPRAEVLTSLAVHDLEQVNWDLLKAGMSKDIIQISTKYNGFSSTINIESLIKEHFPAKIQKPADKNQVQYLFNNLSSLKKKGIADAEHIKKLLQNTLSDLENTDSFGDLKVYLFFLSTANRSFAKEELPAISKDHVWMTVEPYLKEEPARIKEIKKDMEVLGLSEKRESVFKTSFDDKTQKISFEDKPPIPRIVVDGSNIAWQDRRDGKASAAQLLRAYKDLKDKYGFEKVLIIVGAKLRHDTPDYDLLKAEIENGIILESPAKSDNDIFIIKNAIEKDMLILTNDQFNDHRTKGKDWGSEIDNRRVTYMVDPENGELTLNFGIKEGK